MCLSSNRIRSYALWISNCSQLLLLCPVWWQHYQTWLFHHRCRTAILLCKCQLHALSSRWYCRLQCCRFHSRLSSLSPLDMTKYSLIQMECSSINSELDNWIKINNNILSLKEYVINHALQYVNVNRRKPTKTWYYLWICLNFLLYFLTSDIYVFYRFSSRRWIIQVL